MRTALWQAVKRARPTLTDNEVDEILRETASQERALILSGVAPAQARELVWEDLFPPDIDPWAGDAEYGPKR
jgi:hypothetical protein